MAHFVKLDDDGFVVDGIVVSNDDAPDPAPSNSEPLGRAFIAALAVNEPRLEGRWVQTSYSGSFRKQYAGQGFRYLEDADVFIAPQPAPSWTLDENYDWRAPVPMPEFTEDHVSIYWDEDSLSWVEVMKDV